MNENINIIEELQAIKLLLVLSNSEKIDSYLNEVITTTVRRKIWTLVDGKRSPTELANEGNVTPAAITKFLNTVTEASLIKYEKGNPPKRVIEYTPTKWIKEIEENELKQQKLKNLEEKKTEI